MSSLRQRKRTLNIVKELDAFPKVPDGYKETSATRGGVSILVFVVIAALVISEIMYYSAVELNFEYNVDTSFDEKLQINVDMTVAMKCEWIGADVLDLTGERAEMFGSLKEEPVIFELSPRQRQQFDMTRNLNDYIREEYHAIHKLLWRTGYMGKNNFIPAREEDLDRPKDGCRLHGTLTVNKVAGNFHITAGKSVPVFPRGHAHLAMMVKQTDYNFSHRIDHFSFGEPTPGIIAPMDSEEKTSLHNYHMYQYFIQVVPTRVQTMFSSLDTYQYAYTERDRTINHTGGSHGVPGIFVKYDITSLKVTVKEEHKPFWQFLIRLCGIVGGIFATSGMLHGLVGFITDIFCCRFKIGKYRSEETSGSGQRKPDATKNLPDTPGSPTTTDLITGTSLLQNDADTITNPLLNSVTPPS